MKCKGPIQLIFILAVPGAVVGCYWMLGWFFGGAATFAGLCVLAMWAPTSSRKGEDRNKERLRPSAKSNMPGPASEKKTNLVERMLADGRYALLVRPQLVANLTGAQRKRARQELERSMALVPAGDVLMMRRTHRGDKDEAGHPLESVEAFYLDRYPVTNRQFYQFVASGGYQQIALWNEEVLPALLEFVDETETPGPSFWRHGMFPPGKDDHPVVGISWFEADAYARWIGKRLPTDPEWVKAAAWPVSSAAERPLQRNYPWGNTMDRERANVWGSNVGGTAPVTDFADGVSVGGIYQLIGNVWEWTDADFGQWDADTRWLEPSELPKSLRGGAFDTYLETQASNHFQSGDHPLARKHNIGFRCALSLFDLQPAGSTTASSKKEEGLRKGRGKDLSRAGDAQKISLSQNSIQANALEKRGWEPFAGTARRVLRTKGSHPLFSTGSHPAGMEVTA